jgi:broad specificity phosphatase PhoE
MYIYIIRHGQSLGNLRNGFAGHTDYPLSELGHKQARITADFLKKEHIA